MKTYKIDPLGKNRPLMLVRGTRLPESFPDSVAEHMAKSLKANCRGVFTTINGEISSSTVSPGVVISKEANEDNNTLVVMTEGMHNESVDWEDSTGKQFRLEHAGRFAGSQYGGNDPYYTGAYKDLRTFVTGAVPYTGQPLVAANAKQWYSYTTPEGVALTFRGCIQAPVKGNAANFVGLKIDSINYVESDTSPSFRLTLDCDRAVSLGLRNGMNDDSKPFNMITGIGWLQIVATDDFKSHLHEFNEATGNGDAMIASYEAYDGFTYNVDLAAINTQPGGWVPAGNNASFGIYVKSGSALENSIIANVSGFASESLGGDMSGSGDTFPMVEEVFTTLNAEPTVVNLTLDNYKQYVVIRLSSVQDGEKLHLDLSNDVTTSGVVYFRSMNTAVLGEKFIDSGEKNFVIDIPHGDDVFAYFVVNYSAEGTITLSRTKQSEPVEPVRTPGFYSADDQLLKAMTKEEVETNYANFNCPSATTAEIMHATKFVWPEGVIKVGDFVFYGCMGLTSVTIPEGVTSIGTSAFNHCTSLTSVTIPSTVTEIKGYAFRQCSALNTLTVPNTVTTIGTDAFEIIQKVIYGGTASGSPWGALEVEAPARTPGFYSSDGQLVKAMTKEEVEQNCSLDSLHSANESVRNATNFVWPEGVTKVGNNVFYGCSGLTSVTIPDGVTSIGSCAFSWCTGLPSVTIPNTVTEIANGTFYGCENLTEVVIPDGVTSIDQDAFSDCKSLNPLTVPNTVTTIGDGAFNNVPKVIYNGSASGSPWGATEVAAS